MSPEFKSFSISSGPSLAKQANGWDLAAVTQSSDFSRKWICEQDHIWEAIISSRTARRGFPTCANYGFDPKLDGYLYFLEHPEREMFQIEITNFPDNRLGSHNRLGWEVLELRGPMDGHLTRQWETCEESRHSQAGLPMWV